MNYEGELKVPTSTFIALLLFACFVLALLLALAWNCGLYGAGIVDHKISFVTAVGLAVLVGVLRWVLSAAGSKYVTQNVELHRSGEDD